MIKKIQQSILLKNTFIYTILQLTNKGIPFLLLPVLTRFLSSADYGLIAIYSTFVSITAILISLSIPGAISVSYFRLNKEELKNYIGNTFLILLTTTFLALFTTFFFHDLVLTNIKIPLIWIFIAIAVASLQTITNINLTLWRSEQRAKPFALYEISETVSNISLSVLLVILLKYGWEGRTSASASASILFGMFSLLFIFKRGYATINFSVTYIKDILKFGLPLIPHSLASWMRAGADIILITSIVGVDDAGIYFVGYQLGSVVGIIAHAFNNAYSPYLFKTLKNITQKHKIKIVKFTYFYFLLIFLIALSISFLFSIILPYFLASSFQESGQYIIWIALAQAFSGMYLTVVNYIFYAKKTHLISIATFSMSVLHVILSLVLISKYGAMGAAYASVISFFLTFVWVWRISNKVYSMPWFKFKARKQ